ncbi:uncharacterized protein [Glycine max]|nr:uncharacterized protein LOC100804817 isoform X1 [Glycine max]
MDNFLQHCSLAGSRDSNSRRKIWWIAATRSIWNLRNDMIFNNQSFVISKLVDNAIFLTWSWLRGWEKDFNVPFHQCSKGVKANKMQHRNLTSGRPSGTDGSDYSYRMVVDSRYQLVAKGKKRLSLYFITEAVLLLIGVTLTYLPGIEADAPNTVAYSSVIVSVVSLIIGNIGRRRSRSGLLRFYAAVSSIAMLLLIASLAQQHLLLKAIQDSKLWKTGKYDVNELSHFQIGLLLYMVTLSVLKLCTVNAVVSLLFNMAPPKKTS